MAPKIIYFFKALGQWKEEYWRIKYFCLNSVKKVCLQSVTLRILLLERS